MATSEKIALYLWPPELLKESVLIVILYPLRILTLSYHTLAYKYHLLSQLLIKNKPITLTAVWDLGEWVLVGLLIVVLPLVIIKDTFHELIIGKGKDRSGLKFANWLFLLTRLVSYYLITAIILYLFFHNVLTEKMIFVLP